MKKPFPFFVLALSLFLNSCLIENPKPEDCVIETETIINIKEGTSNDIVFSDTDGDHYYINRGLERGLILDSLNAKVLNKTVTLHLPKLFFGTSEHIAQLAVANEVIFTEF
ncbi:hypothetical protein [Ichthyenterobacterium magnum]|uniref:Uncharacterized protein n=1 Tax=Ichthyenterobacterium magnum TaxID=1230530 RepID=A0A420DWC4_9FLAO|nr:hypothetical protein [Ichthyenterobacterium magnum]RKE98519.1 hypothetical protein BXY80_0608 [Ichthyenterobacterium magnum]